MNDPAAPLDPHADSSVPGPTTIQSLVRTGQIISFALIQGVILITAVMTYLAFGADMDGGEEDAAAAGGAVSESPAGGDVDFVLPLIGIVAAVGGGLAAVVVPGAMRRGAVERFRASGASIPLPVPPDSEMPPAAARLLGGCAAATLVGQALLEGPAILNAILMMVQPHLGYLAPIAVLLGGIAMQTPTVEKVQRFLEKAVRR